MAAIRGHAELSYDLLFVALSLVMSAVNHVFAPEH